MTSGSGMVLPIQRPAALESRGVRTLIDGGPRHRHAAAGFGDAQPSYYVANCHKWLCTPKGSAMLCVRAELREGFRPLVLSNNAELPKPRRHHFLTEFDYCGTSDQSGFMRSSQKRSSSSSRSCPAGLMGVMRQGWADGAARAPRDLPGPWRHAAMP